MPSTLNVLFKNGQLLDQGQRTLSDLSISDGKISQDSPSHHNEIWSLRDLYLAPGFIDIQLNGALGIDFSQHAERIREVTAFLPQHGVTGFLPTIITSSPKTYQRSIPLLQQAMEEHLGAQILGIHLEGPFIHPDKKGCHDVQKIVSPPWNVETLESVYGPSLKGVKVVTLAPEQEGALELIRHLSEQGIRVSLGHSTATTHVQDAMAVGATLITHLFNAMPSLHHREPGLATQALDGRIHYGIIADGIHLDPSILRLAWKSHPKGFIAVSDAMAAMGMPPGDYQIGESAVTVDGEKATLKGTNTLAGSILTMDQAFRNLITMTDEKPENLIDAFTKHPAQALGLYPKKGSLAPHADADLVILDRQFRPRATFVQGCCVWKDPAFWVDRISYPT